VLAQAKLRLTLNVEQVLSRNIFIHDRE